MHNSAAFDRKLYWTVVVWYQSERKANQSRSCLSHFTFPDYFTHACTENKFLWIYVGVRIMEVP